MKQHIIGAIALSALLLAGCADDDEITLKSDMTINLYSGETSQIVAESGQTIRYGSLSPYNATVDDNGLVTARFVGNTQVRLKTDDATLFIAVNVLPASSLYQEPTHQFGVGVMRDEIERTYGRDNYTTSADGKTITYKQTDENSNVEAYAYEFNGTNYKSTLVSASVYLKDGMENGLRIFLGERYLPVDEQNWVYRNTLEETAETMVVKYTSTVGSDGKKTNVVTYAPASYFQ